MRVCHHEAIPSTFTCTTMSTPPSSSPQRALVAPDDHHLCETAGSDLDLEATDEGHHCVDIDQDEGQEQAGHNEHDHYDRSHADHCQDVNGNTLDLL